MNKELVSTNIIAKKWGISSRRVVQLCNENEIEGAIKVGGLWKIPLDAAKPDILRNKNYDVSRLLPCPVGITSYKEVEKECYYVDKTLLIKDIIDDHNKVTLFTRPRRFGKTLNMDMLKTYFEKSDEDNSIYFVNRKINACGSSYKKYQGSYPVIYLTFKDAHQETWKDMLESISLTIANEYKRHIEVLDSDKVLDIDKDYFRRVLSNELTNVEKQDSLARLSHLLKIVHNKKVIVIIDEYDTPIQQGYSNGYYDDVIAFMRNLLSALLKDNNDLEFGILTGILRIAKESLFSGLNNLVVNTILDEKYANYFGFSEDEVIEMADYYQRSDKYQEIKEWYDGYLFGKEEIYNPWSVINYFNNDCVPRAFWSRTSNNDILLELIQDSNDKIRASLMMLLQDIPIQVIVDTDIIYPEINRNEDTIYSFLLMCGYLRVVGKIDVIDDNPICNLVIPNKEIKGVFNKEILDNLSKNVRQSIIRDFKLAIKTNNKELLQNSLRQFLLESTSSFDAGYENFYHGMMLGLLAIVSDDYVIISNHEAGDGRFDMELIPYSKKKPGILMEFKMSDDEDKLEILADEAIKQIKDKSYVVKLKRNGINDIQLYGIAFYKKKACVKTKRI